MQAVVLGLCGCWIYQFILVVECNSRIKTGVRSGITVIFGAVIMEF